MGAWALVLSLALGACEMHSPLVKPLERPSAAIDSFGEAALLGGPQAGVVEGGGFELAGGPPPRPAGMAARDSVAEVNGFELAEAPLEPLAPEAQAPSPAGGAVLAEAAPAAAPPEPEPALSRRVARRSIRTVSVTSQTAAPEKQQLTAAALFDVQPVAREGLQSAASDGSAPILGRLFMFGLCLLAAAGLWIWHRHCLGEGATRS